MNDLKNLSEQELDIISIALVHLKDEFSGDTVVDYTYLLPVIDKLLDQVDHALYTLI